MESNLKISEKERNDLTVKVSMHEKPQLRPLIFPRHSELTSPIIKFLICILLRRKEFGARIEYQEI